MSPFTWADKELWTWVRTVAPPRPGLPCAGHIDVPATTAVRGVLAVIAIAKRDHCAELSEPVAVQMLGVSMGLHAFYDVDLRASLDQFIKSYLRTHPIAQA